MDILAQPKPEPLTTAPRFLQWGLLTACSALLASLLELASLPAALLIGPMMAAILSAPTAPPCACRGRCSAAAQAIVGCLIAAALSSEILLSFAADWPLFLAVGAGHAGRVAACSAA